MAQVTQGCPWHLWPAHALSAHAQRVGLSLAGVSAVDLVEGRPQPRGPSGLGGVHICQALGPTGPGLCLLCPG